MTHSFNTYKHTKTRTNTSGHTHVDTHTYKGLSSPTYNRWKVLVTLRLQLKPPPDSQSDLVRDICIEPTLTYITAVNSYVEFDLCLESPSGKDSKGVRGGVRSGTKNS